MKLTIKRFVAVFDYSLALFPQTFADFIWGKFVHTSNTINLH